MLTDASLILVLGRLGRNWTSSINVVEDHALVTGGIYALARHPMYGFLNTNMTSEVCCHCIIEN